MNFAYFKLKLKPGWPGRKKSTFGYLLIFLLTIILVIVHLTRMEGDVSTGNQQTVEECHCNRKFFYNPSGNRTKRLNSTCSDEGSLYEPGQKVVSISMSIQDPHDSEKIALYREGLTENLRRMKEHYPGSTLRLYTDLNLERGSDHCLLLCANPELHWCDVRRTPSLGDQSSMFLMTWRFLPLGDPTVDYFLSRDLDSVIIPRQVAAVKEWLSNSSKPFHLMRDHPDHNVEILGGLWGARNSLLGREEAEALRNSIVKLAKIFPKQKGDDQQILKHVIFSPKAKDILAFDSYFCREDYLGKATAVRPFPIRRKDKHFDFAGNWNLGRAKYDLERCPKACRPQYGKHWKYC